MSPPEQYTYRVEWDDETRSHMATCLEFPSINYFDDTPLLALHGCIAMISDVLVDMRERGLPAPAAGVAS